MWTLLLSRLSQPGIILDRRQVDGDETRIGRSAASADWVIADTEGHLSRHHCTIAAVGLDLYVIDVSTNGVAVNDAGRRIAANQAVPIRLHDRLLLGDYVIEVAPEGATASLAPPPPPPVAMAAPDQPDAWFSDGNDLFWGGGPRNAEVHEFLGDAMHDFLAPTAPPAYGGAADTGWAGPMSDAFSRPILASVTPTDGAFHIPEDWAAPVADPRATPRGTGVARSPAADPFDAQRDRSANVGPPGASPSMANNPFSSASAAAGDPFSAAGWDIPAPEPGAAWPPVDPARAGPDRPGAAGHPRPAAGHDQSERRVASEPFDAFSSGPLSGDATKPAQKPNPPADPFDGFVSPAAVDPFVDPLHDPFAEGSPAFTGNASGGETARGDPLTGFVPPAAADSFVDPLHDPFDDAGRPYDAAADPFALAPTPFASPTDPFPTGPAPTVPDHSADTATAPQIDPFADVAPAPQSSDSAGYGPAAAGWAAFCEGAGLSVDELRASPDAMRRLGALYRQVVLGLSDLIQDRAAFKDEFRVERTQLSFGRNNPLKHLPAVESAKLLLGDPLPGFMDAEGAVRGAFEDVKKHQLAMLAGVQHALTAVFERLAPAEIERIMAKAAQQRKGFSFGRGVNPWTVYQTVFDALRMDAASNVNSVMSVAFREGYEAFLKNAR